MTQPWSSLLEESGPPDHILQLYEDHRFLAEPVALFIASAIKDGEGAIVVATPDHWRELEPLLSGRGVDVPATQARGQLAVLNAVETLPRFMVNGMPDAPTFKKIATEVIHRVRGASQNSKIRWWGEMVNLLWESGNVEAFVRLEELFTEVGRAESVAVFCSVSIDPFDVESHETGLPGALKTHSHMIPAEHYGKLASSVERAMKEVLGEREAKAVRTLIEMSKHPYAKTPAPQAAVLWIRNHVPQFAGEILALAKRYYSGETQVS